MTKEFIKWAEGIKAFIEKRMSKCPVTVDLYKSDFHHDSDKHEITIRIVFYNGMMFPFSFCQKEFDMNSYRSRRSMAKIRRENIIHAMKDHCEDILEVAKRLR